MEVATSFLGTLGDVAILTLGRGTGDIELWRTDGTPAGTTLIRSIAPDGRVDVRPLGAADGTLLFTDGTSRWVTDGTRTARIRPRAPSPSGTTRVAMRRPGMVRPKLEATASSSTGSAHRGRVTSSGRPPRTARTASGSRSSGIRGSPRSGCTGCRRPLPGFAPAFLGALGERMVIASAERRRARQTQPDIGVWISDGTRRGTLRIARLTAEERSWWGDSIAVPRLLSAVADGTMVFTVRAGDRLWRTDGTRAGTARIATGRVAELLAVAATAHCAAVAALSVRSGRGRLGCHLGSPLVEG